MEIIATSITIYLLLGVLFYLVEKDFIDEIVNNKTNNPVVGASAKIYIILIWFYFVFGTLVVFLWTFISCLVGKSGSTEKK